MVDLSLCDIDELNDRLDSLFSSIDSKLKLAGPIMEEIGRLRVEICLISEEIERRRNGGI